MIKTYVLYAEYTKATFRKRLSFETIDAPFGDADDDDG